MMTVISSIALKNLVGCNFMLKYYITVLLWKFTKTLNQLLNLSRANENLEICVTVLFEQLNESKKFWGISLDNALINRSYLKNATSTMEYFMIIVNGFHPLTIITIIHLGCCSTTRSASHIIFIWLSLAMK